MFPSSLQRRWNPRHCWLKTPPPPIAHCRPPSLPGSRRWDPYRILFSFSHSPLLSIALPRHTSPFRALSAVRAANQRRPFSWPTQDSVDYGGEFAVSKSVVLFRFLFSVFVEHLMFRPINNLPMLFRGFGVFICFWLRNTYGWRLIIVYVLKSLQNVFLVVLKLGFFYPYSRVFLAFEFLVVELRWFW